MRKAIAALLLCAAIATGGCTSDGEVTGAPDGATTPPGPNAAPVPSPTFGHGRVIIDTGEDPVLLEVEVADSPETHQVGLMHRTSLPENDGMVFIFFEETSGGFWMKNTLIPLSIAFFDENGRILKILDMDPCTEDPCRIYEPGVAYIGALEVNQGAFERWGAAEGDRIQVNQ